MASLPTLIILTASPEEAAAFHKLPALVAAMEAQLAALAKSSTAPVPFTANPATAPPAAAPAAPAPIRVPLGMRHNELARLRDLALVHLRTGQTTTADATADVLQAAAATWHPPVDVTRAEVAALVADACATVAAEKAAKPADVPTLGQHAAAAGVPVAPLPASAPPPTATPTADDVRACLARYAAAHGGNAAAIARMNALGYKKAGEIPAEARAAFMAELVKV